MRLQTKHLAELCTLAIDDIYGELPSRIFAALLNRGRANLQQLAQYTSLTPKQLRHGVAVLIQYDLLFYLVTKDGTTMYDTNPRAAYNLLRFGKILETVESLYGADAKDVVQSLFALGHTRIADLKDAYKCQIERWEADHNKRLRNGARTNGHKTNGALSNGDLTNGDLANGDHADELHGDLDGEVNGDHDRQTNGETNGETNGTTNGDSEPPGERPLGTMAIKSMDHLNAVLCRLISAEVLEVVNAESFKNFADRHEEAKQSVTEKYFPEGPKGLKKKEEFQTRVAEHLQKLRDEPLKLKRTLKSSGGGRQKLRKLLNGDVTNGFHDEYSDPMLDPKSILRVNHDKCAVELRNQRLMQAAAAAIGETTAAVYGTLLQQLTSSISRCQADPMIDEAGDESLRSRLANTADIFDQLSPNIDVFTGIGKASGDSIDVPTAERLERHARMDTVFFGDHGGAGEGSDDDMDMDDMDYDSEGDQLAPPQASAAKPEAPNGTGATAMTNGKGVKFEDGSHAGGPPSEDARMRQMRQHLLLLCDHKFHFVRHCDRGTWTVDFEPLLRRLREAELDNAIERKVGREGLRLARILRDKGKLDEKTLPTMALMKKGDVQNKMLEMQMHGFVDMQEVPRDNNRSANRTLFLWFCDVDRSMDTLLDNAYKAMVRCLRIRDVHRQENRDVLAFVERPDVKGREKEALEKKYFDKYQRYCEVEKKLMGQVMRLDSLVSTLRDF